LDQELTGMDRLNIGVINVSDRASKGIYEDIPGKAIVNVLREFLQNEIKFHYKVVPDEQDLIRDTLVDMADQQECCLIVTCGGTGPAKRDVTPEATIEVCDKMMPGFGELMRMESLKYVPTAILSRQTAGIRGQTLIVNLPGKPKAIRECLEAVFPAIPYCIDLLEGPYMVAHEDLIEVFRPKSK
jgi:molybdopterin adenylyltransferase